MDIIAVQVPTDVEYQGIMSCIDQYAQHDHDQNFQSIMVIYADAARKVFGVQIEEGQYHFIRKREQNFASEDVLKYAKKIWEKGLIPIEITRENGSLFYAIPQKNFFQKNIDNVKMIYVGREIPDITEFY